MRLTSPAGYQRLFKQYKVAPAFGIYFSTIDNPLPDPEIHCKACAVGIRIIAHWKSVQGARDKFRHYPTFSNDNLARMSGLPMDFVRGLDSGWESFKWANDSQPNERETDTYKAGFREGLAAAQACKPPRQE